ncbi:MAG: hypothetical protein CMP10_06170 [Zetaproteobacteria bacterium]|nr:hypothetical protein [Pseudobdellovibrionaceae bacterium]
MKCRIACHLGSTLLSFQLVSCVSYTDQTREIRREYRSGHYEAALEKINKSVLKESESSRLLYLLEKGSILDRAGRSREARSLWIEADKLADELYTTSISKTAASFVYNDSTMDYGGEEYERVNVHTMLALSFLEKNELRKAIVEARKINSKLAEINDLLGEDSKNHYQKDAFARYLAALIYEAKGEWDSAIIDYKKAINIYEKSYKKSYGTRLPHSLVRSYYRLLLKRRRTSSAAQIKSRYPFLSKVKNEVLGSIVVIHEAGTIAPKREKSFYLRMKNKVIRYSWPVIFPQNESRFGTSAVKVGDNKWKFAELSQDMDSIAYQALEDKRLGSTVKTMARIALKDQITQKAKEMGPFAEIAAGIYNAATETADTRSWTLLPSRFYITRIYVSPGKWDVKTKSNGKLSKIKTIRVQPNQISFIRDAG